MTPTLRKQLASTISKARYTIATAKTDRSREFARRRLALAEAELARAAEAERRRTPAIPRLTIPATGSIRQRVLFACRALVELGIEPTKEILWEQMPGDPKHSVRQYVGEWHAGTLVEPKGPSWRPEQARNQTKPDGVELRAQVIRARELESQGFLVEERQPDGRMKLVKMPRKWWQAKVAADRAAIRAGLRQSVRPAEVRP